MHRHILSAIAGCLLLSFSGLAQADYVPGHNPTLSVSLTADKDVYRPGEAVKMTLMARNESDRTFQVVFSSAKRFDFAVYDPANKAVWRWSADRMFSQSLTSLVIKPGELVVFTASWDQKDGSGTQVLSGEYDLKGAILYQAGTNHAARRITITR